MTIKSKEGVTLISFMSEYDDRAVVEIRSIVIEEFDNTCKRGVHRRANTLPEINAEMEGSGTWGGGIERVRGVDRSILAISSYANISVVLFENFRDLTRGAWDFGGINRPINPNFLGRVERDTKNILGLCTIEQVRANLLRGGITF